MALLLEVVSDQAIGHDGGDTTPIGIGGAAPWLQRGFLNPTTASIREQDLYEASGRLLGGRSGNHRGDPAENATRCRRRFPYRHPPGDISTLVGR